MSLFSIAVLASLGLSAGALVLGYIYLAVVLAWEDQRTLGNAYYGASPESRAVFRKKLHFHARMLRPILYITARLSPVSLPGASFRYEGVAGPKGSCSEESFMAARSYEPQPEDVFVATQMKCGTTWMQHIVYQVLTRGRGSLAEDGSTLYSISPWLEGLRSVSVTSAPLVGVERPSRIIKTHLPSTLCPISDRAKYIYVCRHPVSCFASCVDFLRQNLGMFAPPLQDMSAWYTSDETMWWTSWPTHVDGWWREAENRDNVLFIRFEDMKDDLEKVASAVADFLDMVPLDEAEIAAVAAKCSFNYMRDHASSFEMHPPNLLAVGGELFVKGTSDRHKDVPAETRDDIMTWCIGDLNGKSFPIEHQYPSP